MTYRYVHTIPDCLASGKPLFFGDAVELTASEAKQPHNQFLVTEGRLVTATPEEPSPRSRRKTTTKENT